jgi:predicted ATP-grasp superfamily ATP-dependent carboligase
MQLAIIGIPRTDHTLIESVFQARLRGLDVTLVDIASTLETSPQHLPVARKLALDSLSADEVTKALAPFSPHLIISFTEFNLVLAAQVRQRLGLSGPSVEVEERVRNKDETRGRLCDRGLSAVNFKVTTLPHLEDAVRRFQPPFVIKPTDMTGSIGVYAVRTDSDLDGFRSLFTDLNYEETRNRKFLIEDFIEGDEYSLEGISLNSRFHLLTVTRKRTSGFPHFVEVGHTLPAREHPTTEKFSGFIQDVIEALGIQTAPIHAEVKASDERIELVEIHTRFGGDYIPLLMERAFGYKVFGMFYDAVLSGAPPQIQPAQVISGIQFLNTADITRFHRLSRHYPGITYSLTVKTTSIDNEITSLDNIRICNSRAGHVIFDAATHDEADQYVERLCCNQESVNNDT